MKYHMRYRWVVLFLFLLSAYIRSSSVHAGLFDSINISGTFESEYWDHDPDDWDETSGKTEGGPYKSFENNLSLNLDWNDWFSEVRLRSMEYQNAIHYDANSREHEKDFELFKWTVGYRSEHFNLTVGDFYKSLGRGIVLYVQEDKTLNLDRTIQGSAIEVLTDAIEFNIFGGEIQWYKFRDHPSTNTFDTYSIKDKVFAGRLIGHLPMNITLGASVASEQLYDEFHPGRSGAEDVLVGGGDFEMTGIFDGKLDFYAEYATQRWASDKPFGASIEDGSAFYSSLTAYLGSFTILGEYKDYDYWNNRYTQPPTATRDDEVAESEDVRGGRVKIDYFITRSNTLIYVSLGRFDNHGHETSWGTVVRNRLDQYYVGVEQNWEKLYAHVTYGEREYKTIDEKDKRGTCDLEFHINDSNSLNLYYEYRQTASGETKKDEHESYLTYALSPWISATIHYNRHVIKQRSSEETENWVAGEISATPISSLTISVLYGEMPPGLVCSGGQCRIVPEFDGLQASLSYRF